MKVIAYLLYGRKKEYQLEFFLSLFSALKQLGEDRDEIIFSLITDRDDFDPNLPIDVITISPAELAEWTQQGTYNHRTKAFALLKLIDHYQASVALIDTDTYFIDNPIKLFERISPQNTVMHHLQVPLAVHDHWQSALEKLNNGIDIEGIRISSQSPMFNSGVIGVDVSHRALIEKAAIVLDKVYALFPIFDVEQFAIGVVLNEYTNLSQSNDLIYHYYGPSRRFIHVQTARLFKNFTAASLSQALALPAPPQLGFPERPLSARLLSRILGFIFKWDANYQFAYLAYRCALASAKKDPEYANVWANVALESIKFLIRIQPSKQKSQAILASAKKDFYKFRESKMDSLPWIDPNTQKNWILLWE